MKQDVKAFSVRDMALTAAFTAVLCVVAPFSAALGPIPLSFATFAVYLAGGALGWKRGTLAVALYVALGAVGLPVFTSFEGGFHKIAGVTGGYIVGYIPCAFACGLIGGKGRTALNALGMIIGTAILYTCGTMWFMLQTGSPLAAALALCVTPFLIGDSLKIIVACIIIPRLRSAINIWPDKADRTSAADALSSADILSAATIESHLRTKGVFRVEVRESVTSTNTLLREMAANGAPGGYVLVAGTQTAGRGRMGRSFHSPDVCGVYFSLLLKPEESNDGDTGSYDKALRMGNNVSDFALITSAAAVATARAIEDVTGVYAGIKWVNDLYVAGKKVCGILTEATFDAGGGSPASAVLGIGINITRPEEGYPPELEPIAGALTDTGARGASGGVRGSNASGNSVVTSGAAARTRRARYNRCRIIAATLDHFWGFYSNLGNRAFIDEYRARSIVIGKDIYVLSGDKKTPAHATYIDDDCGLVVRYADGGTETLRSGEVSVTVDDEADNRRPV